MEAVRWAAPLYLQAISILLPEKGKPGMAEKCHGNFSILASNTSHILTIFLAAQLMNNLSALLVKSPPDAEKWGQKALETIHSTPYSKNLEQGGECASTLVAVLFNLASLREVGHPTGYFA